MNQIKHYGQMLGGGVTLFDEAVEEALNLDATSDQKEGTQVVLLNYDNSDGKHWHNCRRP
jgi:hypothetical protein